MEYIRLSHEKPTAIHPPTLPQPHISAPRAPLAAATTAEVTTAATTATAALSTAAAEAPAGSNDRSGKKLQWSQAKMRTLAAAARKRSSDYRSTSSDTTNKLGTPITARAVATAPTTKTKMSQPH